MDYRDKIKLFRIAKHLDQKDVAAVCGVSNKTVSHWENHRQQIPIECIVKFCKYFKVSSDYILGLKENPQLDRKLFEFEDGSGD